MKIERYSITRGHTDVWWEVVPDLEGSMCFYSDVKRLEARNAELLEALKKMLSIQCYVNYAMHRPKYQKAIEQAKTAIAKAEGGNP